MAEGTYEYECMRAELLGLPKPDEKEFVNQQKLNSIQQNEEAEQNIIDTLENENDDLKNVSGGLDELNSILSITQKKLNRFKNACGSLTNLLKIKVGHSESTESIPMKESENVSETSDPQTISTTEAEAVQNGDRKSDLSRILDKQTDKLDSLLINADNAYYSMNHQSKQMKSFLK